MNNFDPQGMYLPSCAPDDVTCDPGVGFGQAPCTPLTSGSINSEDPLDPEPCTSSGPEEPASPTVTCEIGEFYRKAFSKKFSVFYHTYLEASCTFEFGNGSFTSTQVIQADPGPKPNATHPPRVGGLGAPWLIGVISAPYGGPGHSAASAPGNFEVGYLEPIPYSELLQIDDAVNIYDYNPQPYVLFPYGGNTYNSNSFIYTLDLNFNLGFDKPPAAVPGWGNCVPNLPYPTCSATP